MQRLGVNCSFFLQTVAQDLATAQGRLAAAGSELKQIASQAEHDSEELKRARTLIAQLQAQSSSAAEHDSQQLSMAQCDLRQAKADLEQARQSLTLLQKQLSASQVAAQSEQVTLLDDHFGGKSWQKHSFWHDIVTL